MEAHKRKYKKRTTESKISVRYYINTRLKGKSINGKLCYPLYIQIVNKGITKNIKSQLNKYIADEDFEQFLKQHKYELEKEKEILESTIQRFSGKKEQAKYHALKQELRPLGLVIETCLVLEIQFIIAKKDQNAVNYLEKVYKESSRQPSVFHYMLDLTLVSRTVQAFNFQELNAYSLLQVLSTILENDTEIQELKSSFFQELSYQSIYDCIASRYFEENPKLGDWRSHRFQDAILKEYADSPYLPICEGYIRNMNKILLKQERL